MDLHSPFQWQQPNLTHNVHQICLLQHSEQNHNPLYQPLQYPISSIFTSHLDFIICSRSLLVSIFHPPPVHYPSPTLQFVGSPPNYLACHIITQIGKRIALASINPRIKPLFCHFQHLILQVCYVLSALNNNSKRIARINPDITKTYNNFGVRTDLIPITNTSNKKKFIKRKDNSPEGANNRFHHRHSHHQVMAGRRQGFPPVAAIGGDGVSRLDQRHHRAGGVAEAARASGRGGDASRQEWQRHVFGFEQQERILSPSLNFATQDRCIPVLGYIPSNSRLLHFEWREYYIDPGTKMSFQILPVDMAF